MKKTKKKKDEWITLEELFKLIDKLSTESEENSQDLGKVSLKRWKDSSEYAT